MSEHIKELIRQEISNDPLYLYIESEGLDFELFHDDAFFEKLNDNMSYTTSDVARLLGFEDKEWTIRNYLNRYDFHEYIRTRRLSNRITMDYLGVFKFKMIFLVNEHLNKGPLAIAEIIGNVPTTNHHYSNVSNLQDSSGSENAQQVTETMQKMILMTSMISKKERIEEQMRTKSNELLFYQRQWEQEEQQLKDLEDMLSKMEMLHEDIIKREKATISSLTQIKDSFKLSNLFRKNNLNLESDFKKYLESQQDDVTDPDFLKSERERLKERRSQLEQKQKEIHFEIQEDIQNLRNELEALEIRLEFLRENLSENEEKSMSQLLRLYTSGSNKQLED